MLEKGSEDNQGKEKEKVVGREKLTFGQPHLALGIE